MTHAVRHYVQDSDGAAFYAACAYPGGTAVLAATVMELSDGLVQNQIVTQAWGES